MKNIHVLPTENYKEDYKLQNSDAVIQVVKLGQLIFDSSLKEFRINKNKSWAASCDTDVLIPHNIYITSGEEIKEGDWFIEPINKSVLKLKDNADKLINSIFPTCKKIILTTDQALIKDGVQAIDDEFLEWVVNNPSCEEVEVNYQTIGLKNGVWQYHYQIIIPKEKQKQHLIDMMRGDEELGLYEEPKQDWYCPKCQSYVSSESVTFEETHQTCNTGVVIKEPKQETLEEVAERLYPIIETDNYMDMYDKNFDIRKSFIKGAKWQQETLEEAAEKYDSQYVNRLRPAFIAGAKWQQERSYSEEEVLEFTQTIIQQYKLGNTNIEQLDLLKETLQQFKNK